MSGLDDCELTTYAEMANVLGNLTFLVRECRRARRLSMRAAATEMGLAPSVLHRMEQGTSAPALPNVVAILIWLDWATPATAGEVAKLRKAWPDAMLTEEDVIDIRLLHAMADWPGPTEVGRRFGVNACTINDVVKRRSWRHVEPA